MHTINTPRLVLRQWREDDKDAFAALNADTLVMEYFPALLSRVESDLAVVRYQAHIAEHGWGLWAVELKATGEFMGFVGLHPEPDNLPFSPCIEVGWRLARQFWGHGYASEAGSACVNFGFAELGLPRIVSFTAVANVRSQAVMRRLGFAELLFFEHPDLLEGHPLRPHVLFAKDKLE